MWYSFTPGTSTGVTTKVAWKFPGLDKFNDISLFDIRREKKQKWKRKGKKISSERIIMCKLK